MMTNALPTADQTPPVETREEWVVPAIEVMRAGDAEFGANPVIPEGSFGFGS